MHEERKNGRDLSSILYLSTAEWPKFNSCFTHESEEFRICSGFRISVALYSGRVGQALITLTVWRIRFPMQCQANSRVIEPELPGIDWCRKEYNTTSENLEKAQEFLAPIGKSAKDQWRQCVIGIVPFLDPGTYRVMRAACDELANCIFSNGIQKCLQEYTGYDCNFDGTFLLPPFFFC